MEKSKYEHLLNYDYILENSDGDLFVNKDGIISHYKIYKNINMVDMFENSQSYEIFGKVRVKSAIERMKS